MSDSNAVLIDKQQICEILGISINALMDRVRNSERTRFPLPAQRGHSGGAPGNRKKTLWRRSDILEWQAQDVKIPRDACGRRLLDKTREAFDNELALKYLTGQFAPDEVKRQHRYRLIAARSSRTKTQRVSVEGQW